LGKYREEFQAVSARRARQQCRNSARNFSARRGRWNGVLASTQPVAGHHAGLHDCGDLPGMLAKPALRITQTVPELIIRLEIELWPSAPPPPLPSWVKMNLRRVLHPPPILMSPLMLTASILPASQRLRLPTEFCRQGNCWNKSTRSAAAKPKQTPAALWLFFATAFSTPPFERAALPPVSFPSPYRRAAGRRLLRWHSLWPTPKPTGFAASLSFIPYLSIIEQNAAEYSRILGEEVVLENHSGVRPKDDLDEEEESRLELVSENWDAPVIVTTSVQFSGIALCQQSVKVP